MKAPGSEDDLDSNDWITPPAYPFAAHDLLDNLRSQLALELRQQMSYRRLGRLIGKSKSASHRLFTQSEQMEVTALFCMLERLSPGRRHAFINAYCRVNPTFAHARLAHAPAKIRVLLNLLEERAALTLIVGDTESTRLFFATAMGHAHLGMTGHDRSIAGIDVHRPANFVPVEGLHYLDGTLDAKRLRQLIAGRLPRILMSAAPLLVFNGVWDFVPDLRRDILRSAAHKHVILVEAGTPNLALVKKLVQTPVNLVSLSASKLVREGIRVICRRVRTNKAP